MNTLTVVSVALIVPVVAVFLSYTIGKLSMLVCLFKELLSQ